MSADQMSLFRIGSPVKNEADVTFAVLPVFV